MSDSAAPEKPDVVSEHVAGDAAKTAPDAPVQAPLVSGCWGRGLRS